MCFQIITSFICSHESTTLKQLKCVVVEQRNHYKINDQFSTTQNRFSKLTLELLNSLSAKEFHTTFGNVVECHPEAAVACSKKLPFASVDAVISTFDDYLQQLNVETKTRVLRSFPDLAGKLLDSHQLTEESTYEHACAGLDKLMAEDRDKLTTLNRK